MKINELHTIFLKSTGVNTDTRTLVEGQLFFALKGANFNGNLYAAKALSLGASAVVVDEDLELENPTKVFRVSDTLQTLQDLATFHRTYLNTPVLGITGSNGKTTTKELVAAVLSQQLNVHFTQGNLNNHIGVPLTLLQLQSNHDFAIIEMGANQPNDIAELCEIAKPNYGYITNIGSAHLEGFGSLSGVYRAKTKLFDYVIRHGELCFVNCFDCHLLNYPIPKSKAHYLRTALKAYTSEEHYLTIELGDTNINTRLTGSYNIDNINAAITIGTHFGISQENITKGLTNYHPTNNRSQIIKRGQATVILDAYNANPTSMQKSITNLLSLEGRSKVVVLGDMNELGDEWLDLHITLIQHCIESEIEGIALVGPLMLQAATHIKSNKLSVFETYTEAKEWFDHYCEKDSIILIKGSRSNKLERLINEV